MVIQVVVEHDDEEEYSRKLCTAGPDALLDAQQETAIGAKNAADCNASKTSPAGSSGEGGASAGSSSSKSASPLVVDELDLSDSGESGMAAVKSISLSPENLLNPDSFSSRSSRCSAASSSSTTSSTSSSTPNQIVYSRSTPPGKPIIESEVDELVQRPPLLLSTEVLSNFPALSSSTVIISTAAPSVITSSPPAPSLLLKRKHSMNGSPNSPSEQVLSIEKRHKCEICGKGFPYLSILESHKRCHTGEKPFNCHFCDKAFAQKATLQVHERTHTGERPYKCKYCPKTFAQYGTKTVHEKSAHLGIRNYKCPKCSKCLSSPSALYTHKKTHGDKCFQCTFCPKTFTLKNYLKLHIKQVHEHNERKHVCKFCGKTFAYAGSLQVHTRTHTGERPYMCRFCPKAFASQGNLQSHERTHTGERPYTCLHCGRSFIQKSQLTAHEATHSYGSSSSSSSNTAISATSTASTLEFDEQPTDGAILTPQGILVNGGGYSRVTKQNEFVCKFCGKRYAYASSLYVHTRLHTGERPFRCNFCEKSFTNQGNMQVHQRVHTGEKPYKCEACGKSYAQKVGLKIHQEQCQIYLNRRGSVMTVGTTESESSPTSEAADERETDDIVQLDADEEKHREQLNGFLNFQRSLHQHSPNNNAMSSPSQSSSIFSSPIHSQRGSFSLGVPAPSSSSSCCSSSSFFDNPPNLTLNQILPGSSQLNNVSVLNELRALNQQQLSGTHFNGQSLCSPTGQFPSALGITDMYPLQKSSVVVNQSLQSSPPFLLKSPPVNNHQFNSLQKEHIRHHSGGALASSIVSPPTAILPNSAATAAAAVIAALASSQGFAQPGVSQQVPGQSLVALLLEQIDSHNQQQQQIQQLNALKALMDLSSIGGGHSVSLRPPSTPLPQPQPLYVHQPQQPPNTTHQPTFNQQQQILNSQIHQQLLNQLLFQGLSSSSSTGTAVHQAQQSNDGQLPSLRNASTHQTNNSVTSSSQQQQQMSAAASALHEFSKQQQLEQQS